MQSKIKKLPPETIRKIAAGEVVDRPASIIKELIENALDAGAKHINIHIKNGGIDFIEVSDDGSGIEPDDLLAAINLHATSKLTSIEDLEQILTFGFRGEALASISAAADLEIISASSSGAAHRLSPQQEIEPAARNQGTTIIVRDLFRTIPARRKFLKSAHTEELNIRNLIKQFAILNHNIAFKYSVDSKQIFDLKATTQAARITILVSTLNPEDLIQVQGELEQIQITGFIAHPRTAQKRPQQYIYVNQRNIRSSLITAAVKKAFSNKIPPELNPYFFLELNLNQADIDVNVHPRKEEVKFSDDNLIFRAVLHTVEDSLNTHLRQEFEARFNAQTPNSNSPTVTPLPRLSTTYPSQISRKPELITPTANKPPSPTTLESSSQLLQDGGNYYSIDSKNSKSYYQVFKTYIITTQADNLLIIDQHAADERVKYEKFKTAYSSGEIEQTPLLLPASVEIPTTVNQEHLTAVLKELLKLGLTAELEGTELKITHVPTLIINKLNFAELFTNILTDLESEQLDFSRLEQKLDRVIATLACHSSIRAGEELSSEQIEKLLVDLWLCQDPYTCPHGRPIVYEQKRSELEKKFLRIK